jgi:hypothetical protein
MKKKQTKKPTPSKKATPKGASKKNDANKWIVVGLAGATVLGLSYFAWKYLKHANTRTGATLEPLPGFTWPAPSPVNTPQPATPTPVYQAPVPVYHAPAPVYRPSLKPQPPNPPNDSFPLKRGSRGDQVIAFQQALINTYGKEILPRYGADGQFGAELSAALKKLKLPATIDQTTFNILVKSGGTTQGSQQSMAQKIAASLINTAEQKDFSGAIKTLQQISDIEGYSAVNAIFKNRRVNGGVRQTLVTGMLHAFSEEKQKRDIRLEFQRMGLIYDGNKWSLSGLDGLTIVTIAPATVWTNARQQVQVPARTVLGTEIARRLDYTLFENKGKHFLVQTANVTYL